MRIRRLGQVLLYFFLVLVLLGILFPFLWMVSSSFKTNDQIFAGSLLPTLWTFLQYFMLLTTTKFARWILNSAIIALASTLIGAFACTLAGYGFAKYEFRGKRLLFWLILGSLSIPPFTTLIPLFGWMAKLHLLNTYWALILPFSVSALGIFLMYQYLASLPSELLDAARIDGASELAVFIRIVLPLARPGLAVVVVTIFLDSWNSYLFPLVLMRTPDMSTFTTGLASLNSVYFIQYGLLMAGGVLSTLPILILFFLMQRQFIAGLTQGAIRG